jgi:hypothetical protein
MSRHKKTIIPITGYFDHWPFSPGESEIVHWYRSPQMTGDDKQWMMEIIFRRPDGSLQELNLPWGTFPKIRLGMEFIDGLGTSVNKVGEDYQFELSDRATFRIEKAITISPKIYPLKTHENLREYCVVIFDKALTLVVPCLELIRFFFAVNKIMAFRVLQPFNFGDLVSASIDEKSVFLNYTKKMPSYILNRFMAKFLAKILFNPSWSEAWKSVYIGREEQMLDGSLACKDLIPLRAYPPVYSNSAWEVRGLNEGKRIIVMEIISCIDKNLSPFNQVGYNKHFNIYTQEHVKHYSKKTKSLINHETKAKISRSKIGSKNGGNPILIRSGMPLHEEEEKILIKENRIEDTIDGIKWTMVPVGVNPEKDKLKDIKVSFNDESRKGTLPAGEFFSIVDIRDKSIPQGLRKFFDALNFMKELDEELSIDYSIDIVPAESVLSYCGINPRKFAFVEIKSSGKLVYIIEFDISDEHNISTLIFSPNKLGMPNEIIRQYIIGQGNWAKEKLKENKDVLFDWGKHTSSDYIFWGKRLYDKISSIYQV